MGIFDTYLKNELVSVEEAAFKAVAPPLLATEMAHIQKFVYIDQVNSSWANSVFKSIYDVYKQQKRASRAELNEFYSMLDKKLDEAYRIALDIIANDNQLDLKNIPSTRPTLFTFDFLMSYDQVKDYLLRNAKNHDFDDSIIKQYNTYSKKRIN